MSAADTRSNHDAIACCGVLIELLVFPISQQYKSTTSDGKRDVLATGPLLRINNVRKCSFVLHRERYFPVHKGFLLFPMLGTRVFYSILVIVAVRRVIGIGY